MASSPTAFAPQKPLEDPLAHLPCSSIVEYRKGQMIYNQDQPSTSIYLVIDGKVKVSRLADDGHQVVVDIYQPDEFFGESAFLNLPHRSEQATALENTKLMTWTTVRDRGHRHEAAAPGGGLCRAVGDHARRRRADDQQVRMSTTAASRPPSVVTVTASSPLPTARATTTGVSGARCAQQHLSGPARAARAASAKPGCRGPAPGRPRPRRPGGARSRPRA